MQITRVLIGEVVSFIAVMIYVKIKKINVDTL